MEDNCLSDVPGTMAPSASDGRYRTGRFMSYPVGFLRRYLSGNKRLPDLIAENIRILFLLPARERLVFGFRKQKFRVGGFMVAHIRENQFTLLCFLRVLPVVEAVSEGLRYRFSLADMMGFQIGCRHARPSFQQI